ncbi:MAG TPA: pilus assembly protein PilM [Phycisphaerae bacterium]|nr:pilus assembly protein PilM [Phycisphaerae bacterium]
MKPEELSRGDRQRIESSGGTTGAIWGIELFRRRPKHGPIGVDIGTSSIKLLQFSDDAGHPAVVAAAHHQIPLSVEDPSERQAAIERALSEALRQQPFQGRDAVSAMGISSFQMKSIRLPKMPPEELATAVEFEAKDRFDLGGQSAQFRFIVAGEVRHGNELKQEIIVFASPDDEVRARLELLEACKLRPIALDITPCAVARSFVRYLRRAEDAQAVNVFMDVGWRGTSIVVTHGAELTFLKVIDVGGEHFSNAVAQTLSISREEAADLRIRIMRGSGGRRAGDANPVPDDVQAAVSDAVRPLVERLARDVQLCLRYFAVTFRGQRPESLTFVGGEAHEPSLAKIVGEAVDVPCTIGHPLRGVGRLGLLGGRDRRSIQPAWTVASGLALRGSQWVKTPESHALRNAVQVAPMAP